jgi:hypothetical protein
MAFLDTIKDEAREVAQTLTGITFSKSYKEPQTFGKQLVGFNENTFQSIDPKYRVVIENNCGGSGNKGWIVNAWLQEGFEFDVNSTWVDLINIPSFRGLSQTAENIIQGATKAFGGVSLKNMAMTRRKWDGSSPLKINLKLKFRTYDDAQREVIAAVHALQSMALPEEATSKTFNGAIIPGFLIPPGPNEQFLNSSLAVLKAAEAQGNARINNTLGGEGDLISVDLFGGAFYLDMVVIKSVKATFDPKMTDKGPVAAVVDVAMESYEVLTKQKLNKAYQGEGYLSSSSKGVGGPTRISASG